MIAPTGNQDVGIVGPSPPVCDVDGSEKDHSSKDCDKPLTPEFLATITCRQCDQIGHLKANCPERPKFTCSNCDQEGHKKSECPVNPVLPSFQSLTVGTPQYGQSGVQGVQ